MAKRWIGRRQGLSLTELLVSMALLGLCTVLSVRLLMAMARGQGISPSQWALSLRCLHRLRRELEGARFIIHPRPRGGPRRGRCLVWLDWTGRIRALVSSDKGLELLDLSKTNDCNRETLPFPKDVDFFCQHRGEKRRSLRLRFRCGGRMILTSVRLQAELEAPPPEILCTHFDEERSQSL